MLNHIKVLQSDVVQLQTKCYTLTNNRNSWFLTKTVTHVPKSGPVVHQYFYRTWTGRYSNGYFYILIKLWKKKKLKLPKPTKMKKFKGKGYKNGTKAPPGSQHFKKPKKQLVDCTDEKLMLQLLSELLLPNGNFHWLPDKWTVLKPHD